MSRKGVLIWVGLLILTVVAKAADPVKGDGNLTTKKLSVSDFNEVRINGLMEFYYGQSDETPSVEITLDQNLFSHLRAEVKNRILTIDFKGVKVEGITKFRVNANSKWLKSARIEGNAAFNLSKPLTGDEVVIKATANSLVQLSEPVRVGKLELQIRQSGNIVATLIETEHIKCDMDGAGSITLKGGDAATGNYSITGSSDIHAYGFEVPVLTCKITGSGLAEIHATEQLKASIIGNGTIRYKGSPEVSSNILGKGTINKE